MIFFEGSEKKVEVVVNPELVSLRDRGYDFWSSMVEKSEAEILAVINNSHCDAYLLSESSLFVWDDRFLMLTCGTTSLVNALLFFLDHCSSQHILFASFQRKNEYQPHLQKTTFEEDIRRISNHLSGRAWRLGNLDSHHNYLFHLDHPFQPGENDQTTELLMYHIQGEGADYLRSTNQTSTGIRQLLELDALLPGFQLSDWLFEPFGYSLNAIRGDRYATFHITPQEESSYVSFETNLNMNIPSLVGRLLEILRPGSCDLIGFNSPTNMTTSDFTCVSQCHLSLSCGYDVDFHHYQHRDRFATSALEIRG